jgi:hypothetical protein
MKNDGSKEIVIENEHKPCGRAKKYGISITLCLTIILCRKEGKLHFTA